MANANKRKGDEAERAAKNTLRRLGFPWTEKTRAGYARDAGDLHLVPGPAVIAQVKNWRTPDWREWLRQLRDQVDEARADFGYLIVKRPGMTPYDASRWLAVMTVEDHARLLRAAGYGTTPGEVPAPVDDEPAA